MSDHLTLDGAVTMPASTTEYEGHWYLRQWYDDLNAVRLVSARAPAGTRAVDLKPACVEIDGDEETLSISVDALREFMLWPPSDDDWLAS